MKRLPGLDWLFRIRSRLLLVNVLIVAVPLLGVSFARFYEREMLRSLEEDMIHQAQLVRALLLADSTGLRLDQRSAQLASAARDTRTRIRLLGPDGSLQSDSHANGPPEGPERPPPNLFTARAAPEPRRLAPPEPQDVSSRAEVRAALRGKYGAATRLWEDHGTLYLFSALPITRDNRIEGVVYVTRSTNPVRAAMYRLRTKLFGVLAGSLAVTLVLSMFLAGTISRPLTRLTRMAERIAGGDRTLRLKLERRDEIGQLARAFDSMRTKLDERATYVAQLAANISHEFKSPLTSIRGAAELLMEGAADDPQARERFLDNILVDAHRLDRLVTRLLELSRLEADTTPREMLDYEALVRELSSRSQPAPVKVTYRASATHLLGRRPHLVSALGNLLDNAQQHAQQGSTIEVHVGDGPGHMIRTSVINQGPVIREANLARIWDRFFTTRSEQGGTGLGLPIVKSVVEAHGGAVSVTSSEGQGTCFSFDLPTVGR